MSCIRILLNFDPIAKARPRTTMYNGKVHTYTPETTQAAQTFVTERLKRHSDKAFAPLVPVKVTVTFYRHKSKYLPRRETMPTRKPDLDNFLKLILDSMNGILIADDAQITTIHVRKRWSTNGKGCVKLKLEEDNG